MEEDDYQKRLQKKYKITDPEILISLLCLIPVFLLMFVKYLFPQNPIVLKYFTGFPQFILIVFYFILLYFMGKNIITKADNNTLQGTSGQRGFLKFSLAAKIIG